MKCKSLTRFLVGGGRIDKPLIYSLVCLLLKGGSLRIAIFGASLFLLNMNCCDCLAEKAKNPDLSSMMGIPYYLLGG